MPKPTKPNEKFMFLAIEIVRMMGFQWKCLPPCKLIVFFRFETNLFPWRVTAYKLQHVKKEKRSNRNVSFWATGQSLCPNGAVFKVSVVKWLMSLGLISFLCSDFLKSKTTPPHHVDLQLPSFGTRIQTWVLMLLPAWHVYDLSGHSICLFKTGLFH